MKVEGAQNLGKSFQQLNHKNLTHFSFILGGFNSIKQDGCKYICEGIACLKNLRELNLTLWNNNRISTGGAIAIGDCLKKFHHLHNLNLTIGSENFIKNEGIIAISKGIHALHKKLNVLSLRIGYDNQIYPEGVESLMH